MANLEQRVAERTAELMQTEARYASLFDVGSISFAEMDFSAVTPMLAQMRAEGVTDLRAHFQAHPDLAEACLSGIATTRVNRALAHLMGYDSLEELAANPPADNAEDGREVLLRQLEMAFDQVDHIDGRTVLVCKDGRRIPVHYAVNRLSEGLHLSSLIDLSEQERIAEIRRAAQDELARANRVATIGAFSATIAHELNQPIASMAMDVETAGRWLQGETPNLEAVTRSIERLTRTVGRVKSIVERTRANLAPHRHAAEPIDVGVVARETCQLLEGEVKRAGAQLTLECAPNLPLVKADPVEFQQILVNLITNAGEAMLAVDGPRHIAVSIPGHADGLAVAVCDTGPGIPESLLERLFEPFFTTKPTGMGMGLQVCRNAVQGMGGQLVARNLAEGGAAFRFTLPAEQLSA